MPPEYVLDSDLFLYRTATGYSIALNFDSPGPEDTMRVLWTASHAANGSTIPGKDFYAVVDYASSLALNRSPRPTCRPAHPSIAADVVNLPFENRRVLEPGEGDPQALLHAHGRGGERHQRRR